MTLTRRLALILMAATLAAPAHASDGILTAAEAHRAAQAGEILLVDIRRPDEWRRTGIPEGALPLDMRRPDFVVQLDQAVGGDRSRPVALICAAGVRTARVASALRRMGFSDLHDVSEGMTGSRAGPGWLRAGLPVTPAN
jgi:rhodanese-related sulfurtransferase